ncbi:MAG: DUF3267 domain-containing protein [Ruminococcus flavefaciens]|nr:DUF3267 domain-containing protein [Ruminococcus flavefaciens]MCM1229750.1 DUF3267 domain-containing protein [Ruminococcus flavefaciens]
MKFHYAGTYNGDENSLPQREHPTGYVQFREPKNMKTFAIIMNIMAFVMVFSLLFLASAVAGKTFPEFINIYGIVASLVSLVPHEFLHALCFKGDVYMYQNLKQSMMFVVGTEDMSKGQFIFMSLLPNIVFGFIPFIIFLIFPNLVVLGTLGAMAIGMGAGDYLNVFNCLTQVPNGAKVYSSGMHSYWYK